MTEKEQSRIGLLPPAKVVPGKPVVEVQVYEDRIRSSQPSPSNRVGWKSFPMTVDFPADAENHTPKKPSPSEPED